MAAWCLIGVNGVEMTSHLERDPKSSLSISALKAFAVYSAHLISGLSYKLKDFLESFD